MGQKYYRLNRDCAEQVDSGSATSDEAARLCHRPDGGGGSLVDHRSHSSCVAWGLRAFHHVSPRASPRAARLSALDAGHPGKRLGIGDRHGRSRSLHLPNQDCGAAWAREPSPHLSLAYPFP